MTFAGINDYKCSLMRKRRLMRARLCRMVISLYFIRLGSDYKNNYYEYEVPLDLTPHSTILYNTNNSADQEKVWPLNNDLEF